MIKHIILWKLRDDIPADERPERRAEVKRRLENLNGKIDGLLRLEVKTEGLPSSTADMMLDSEFTTEAALLGYRDNPLHVEAAEYVRSVVAERLCLDFEA